MSLNHQTSDWIVVSRTKINQIWKLLKYNQWSIYNYEAKRLSLNNLISLSKKKIPHMKFYLKYGNMVNMIS